MRIRELSLFLLFLLLAVFNHERLGVGIVRITLPAVNATSVVQERPKWQYDESSPLYSALPGRVQLMSSERPAAVAGEVCAAFGGNLDIIQQPSTSSRTVGFNCAFHEPGLSMSADFGELRRSALNK